MNIVATIEANSTSPRASRFLDEDGNPCDIVGPDLTKARSVEAMIASLKGLRTDRSGTYSSAFYHAAKESGIHLSTMYWSEGSEEQLQMILPCDGQEELRHARYEALKAHIHARPGRRQAVIDLVNLLGHFADNRPYSSLQEAADLFIANGGRIYVLSDGTCEEILPYGGRAEMEDSWDSYPVHRMMQRYEATLRRKGAREEMAKLVRVRGEDRNGSIVWERKDA